jgi:hypothetical protein
MLAYPQTPDKLLARATLQAIEEREWRLPLSISPARCHFAPQEAASLLLECGSLLPLFPLGGTSLLAVVYSAYRQ